MVHFDHCHKNGHFRGWLCFGCNTALGAARDSAKILRKLADYIDADKQRDTKKLEKLPIYIWNHADKDIKGAEMPMKKSKGLDVGALLTGRAKRYGAFKDHAIISQGLQDVMRAAPGWQRLAPDQKEALIMVQHKVARVLNGDPDYVDNYVDIAGYAKLVADRLEVENVKTEP